MRLCLRGKTDLTYKFRVLPVYLHILPSRRIRCNARRRNSVSPYCALRMEGAYLLFYDQKSSYLTFFPDNFRAASNSFLAVLACGRSSSRLQTLLNVSLDILDSSRILSCLIPFSSKNFPKRLLGLKNIIHTSTSFSVDKTSKIYFKSV